ncbi:hypothetical protein BS78_05G195700 [Paspalum vaginatum]|uniref:Uncharacterized protein n=1 Tax=Paspalum vaginatum TaxID=158149 RepID=A0A9W7XCW6_9POAL|nr:hypothetical protein BS78_K123000 [Paspalum vaginatum]KAJ1276195.1 hypothetical protein BS78_05G195700 [Paspalum vaginatum]
MAAKRQPAMHLAVAALALCCCLIHAPSAAAAFPPGLEVMQQDTRAAPPVRGADNQGVLTPGKVEAAGDGAGGRMDLELVEDYPGSGANDRHSPWAQERRN